MLLVHEFPVVQNRHPTTLRWDSTCRYTRSVAVHAHHPVQSYHRPQSVRLACDAAVDRVHRRCVYDCAEGIQRNDRYTGVGWVRGFWQHDLLCVGYLECEEVAD